jgi:hypothetical protein
VVWDDVNDADPRVLEFFENVRFLHDPDVNDFGLPDRSLVSQAFGTLQHQSISLSEGALVRAERNGYERNPEARRRCSAH